jgi:hypothetical protein
MLPTARGPGLMQRDVVLAQRTAVVELVIAAFLWPPCSDAARRVVPYGLVCVVAFDRPHDLKATEENLS